MSVGTWSWSPVSATHEVLPPYLTNSGPGAGVEPRTPHSCKRMKSSLPDPLTAVAAGQFLKRLALKLRGRDGRYPARGQRGQGRGPHAALQVGALAKHGTRPVLRQPFAIPLNPDHAVEQEVDLIARLSLPHHGRTGRDLGDLRLSRAVHQLHGQRLLQGGLHRGHQGL